MKASHRLPIFATLVVLLLPVCGSAQTTNTALPLKAQQAFDSGLAAAQRQDWGSAIRYLTEAQQTAPLSRSILFNLGLAHARAGHEVAAIAWLHAYLLASSAPSDAALVQQEITTLAKVAQLKVRKLMDVAAPLKNHGSSTEKDLGLFLFARKQAESGDRDGCVQSVKLSRVTGPALSNPNLLCGPTYALYLAKAGDREEALATLRTSGANVDYLDSYLEEFVYYNLQWDDYESASFFANQFHDPGLRKLWLNWISIARDPERVIAIPREGEFYVGKERIERSALRPRIRDFTRGRGDGVVIKVDRQFRAKEVLDILTEQHIFFIFRRFISDLLERPPTPASQPTGLVISDKWLEITSEWLPTPASQPTGSQAWVKLAIYLSSQSVVVDLEKELSADAFPISSWARQLAEHLNEVRALEKRLKREKRPL